jgi:hypothetical protein
LGKPQKIERKHLSPGIWSGLFGVERYPFLKTERTGNIVIFLKVADFANNFNSLPVPSRLKRSMLLNFCTTKPARTWHSFSG